MKPLSLLCVLLGTILIGCLGICPDDCPGVVGKNGKFYCNSCYARDDGTKVRYHFKDFRYYQAVCNDPWGPIEQDSLAYKLFLIEDYLKGEGIINYGGLMNPDFRVTSVPDSLCDSCACLTGIVFGVSVADGYTDQMLDLGFFEED